MNNLQDFLKDKPFYFLLEMMIKGLENMHVKVDMSTFGKVKNGICYGCAATNVICEIFNVEMTPKIIESSNAIVQTILKKDLNVDAGYYKDVFFLESLEDAIDHLRQGDLSAYNYVLKSIDLYTFKIPQNLYQNFELPTLETHNYGLLLNHYKEFLEFLKNTQDAKIKTNSTY